VLNIFFQPVTYRTPSVSAENGGGRETTNVSFHLFHLKLCEERQRTQVS
jgi:hypothetical protein